LSFAIGRSAAVRIKLLAPWWHFGLMGVQTCEPGASDVSGIRAHAGPSAKAKVFISDSRIGVTLTDRFGAAPKSPGFKPLI